MRQKLKFWYYRVFKYRAEKIEICMSYKFKPGDIVVESSGYNLMCIGKGYYVPTLFLT